MKSFLIIYLIFVIFSSEILCKNVVVHLNHTLWLNQSRNIQSYVVPGTTITYIVKGFNENNFFDWYKYEVFGNPLKLKENGKYFVEHGDNFSNLTITNLTNMDKGNYSTFQLTNNKWNIFSLRVRYLLVRMNSFYYFQNSSSKESRQIECRLYYYTNETIIFTVKRCPYNNCYNFKPIPNQKIHFEKPLYETGIVKFFLTYLYTKSKTVRCSAINSKNLSISWGTSVIIGPYPDYFIIIPRDISYNISNQSSIIAPIGKKLYLDCLVVSDLLKGEIKWLKNNRTFDSLYDKGYRQIKEIKNISTLSFTVVTLEIEPKLNDTEEIYSCQALLTMNNIEEKSFLLELNPTKLEKRDFVVIFNVTPQKSILIWIPITIIFFVLIILGIIFIIRNKLKEKINQNEIYEMELNHFFENQPLLYDFIKNLQYNEHFEFPENKLKIGNYIGLGNFGIVQKGLATGILKNEEKTVVAVKSVSNSNNIEALGALISEMRILIILGKHINVVNFLASVSKDFSKGKLKVIVEYCPYGSLKKFLQNNRQIFFNQINPNTDEINPKIGYETSNRESTNGDTIKTNDDPISISSQVNLNKNEVKINYSSSISELSNNDKKKKNNNVENIIPYKILSTFDLICWAYQITFGMTYISQRKIIHGDLAARNILLAENNIVKICDFGLAKIVSSQYENFNTNKEEQLPLRWLALEILENLEFSIESDIWSFGILLWELFTLGDNPYPGINVRGLDFINLLKKGYRMEKPEFCNHDIYNIMLKCWNSIPSDRPSFSELQEQLSTFLESDYYMKINKLNEPFEKANLEYNLDKENPYLEMRSKPEVLYVNSERIQDVEQSSKSENEKNTTQ